MSEATPRTGNEADKNTEDDEEDRTVIDIRTKDVFLGWDVGLPEYRPATDAPVIVNEEAVKMLKQAVAMLEAGELVTVVYIAVSPSGAVHTALPRMGGAYHHVVSGVNTMLYRLQSEFP